MREVVYLINANVVNNEFIWCMHKGVRCNGINKLVSYVYSANGIG